MKDTINEFKLKNRNDNGHTPILNYWGASSEYGVLKDVLLGPVENYRWLKTSSVSKKTIRRNNEFKPDAEEVTKEHVSVNSEIGLGLAMELQYFPGLIIPSRSFCKNKKLKYKQTFM